MNTPIRMTSTWLPAGMRPGRRHVAITASVAVLAISLAGPFRPTGEHPGPTGPRASTTTAHHTPAEVDRHVVAISVDGLRPAAVRRLGRAGTPTLHRMIRRGASTLQARTLRERTTTLPNHASMLTGRRATGPHGHGVDGNHDPGGTVHGLAGHRVDSIFGVVHGQGGRTALYASKEKFALFDRTWPAGIDRYRQGAGRRNVTALLRRLTRRPDALTFLHLAHPDVAGHTHGFTSRRYLRAVRRTDALVGRVLRVVARDPGLSESTRVVVTSDHGGAGLHHSRPSRPAHFTVPLLVWGRGVARGADLYRLNPDLRKPRPRQRTTYRGAQPVRNADLGNLVLDLLDLPPVSGSRFNRRQTLAVSRVSGAVRPG